MSAPVNELAILLVIMAGMVLAERIVGARRFWSDFFDATNTIS